MLSDDIETGTELEKQSTSISRQFSDLFNSVQGSDSVLNDQNQAEVDRNYILSLQKSKPDHAKYYKTLKKRLISQFGVGTTPA